jgi:alginate O-acetyltransferase complex protein AlgI
MSKNNLVFRVYVFSFTLLIIGDFLLKGDISLFTINKCLSALLGSILITIIYQVFKIKLIAYVLFFTTSITLLFSLSEPMTGMYVDSSNTVLFGLSFYSLSLGYMIHRNNKLNIKDIIIAANPLILFTGPIAIFHKDYSKTSLSRRFSIFFPYLILGLFFFKIIGTPLTNFFFLINSTDSFNVILYGIIFELFIYFNFAGLSLIVYAFFGICGLGIPLNFRQPFSSRNLIEFWRGWHVTLSSVLKNLFYNPVRTKSNGSIALFVVFLSSAMWHGVTVNFIFWGTFHATCFIITKLLLNNQLKFLPSILMIFGIIFGRILFSDSDIDRLLLKLSFRNFNFDFNFLDSIGYNSILSLILGLLIVFSEFIFKNNRFFKQKSYKIYRLPAFQLILVLLIILLISSSNGLNFAAYGQR